MDEFRGVYESLKFEAESEPDKYAILNTPAAQWVGVDRRAEIDTNNSWKKSKEIFRTGFFIFFIFTYRRAPVSPFRLFTSILRLLGD